VAWVQALVPLLEQEARVEVLAAAGPAAVGTDLDLYHVADDPAHGFVYRALGQRPGLVLLADWSLRHLVRAETAGRGDLTTYLAEARRAHGDTGAFIGRQEASGLGGELSTLLVLNDRVLEASLGLVAFTESVRARAAARLPGRPVVHLPLDLVGQPGNLPGREAARGALGAPAGATLVALASAPGAQLALAAACAAEPSLLLRPWPDEDDASSRLLAAADVVVALGHPPWGSPPSLVARAVAAGLPTLVSAGSAAADLPGVVEVSPGPSEGAELEALLLRLSRDVRLRVRVGALARAHRATAGDPAPAAAALLDLVRLVLPGSEGARRAFAARGADAETLLAAALDELRWPAREVGLAELPPGVEPLVVPLLRAAR